MALVKWIKTYIGKADQDAPRADWQESVKTGPVGQFYPGQHSDLHEDEVQNVLESGHAVLVERAGGEMTHNRPLWTDVKAGEETGGEEQATIEDRPVTKRVVSAQGSPVTATRKFDVPGRGKEATFDPATDLGDDLKATGKDTKKAAKK